MSFHFSYLHLLCFWKSVRRDSGDKYYRYYKYLQASPESLALNKWTTVSGPLPLYTKISICIWICYKHIPLESHLQVTSSPFFYFGYSQNLSWSVTLQNTYCFSSGKWNSSLPASYIQNICGNTFLFSFFSVILHINFTSSSLSKASSYSSITSNITWYFPVYSLSLIATGKKKSLWGVFCSFQYARDFPIWIKKWTHFHRKNN